MNSKIVLAAAISAVTAAIGLISTYEKPSGSAAPSIDHASMKCFVAGSFSDPMIFTSGQQSKEAGRRFNSNTAGDLMAFTNTFGGTTKISTMVSPLKNKDNGQILHWNTSVQIERGTPSDASGFKLSFSENPNSGAGIKVDQSGWGLQGSKLPIIIPANAEETNYLIDADTELSVVSNQTIQKYAQSSTFNSMGLVLTQKLTTGGKLRTIIMGPQPYFDVVSESNDGLPALDPNSVIGKRQARNPMATPDPSCPTPAPVQSEVPTGPSPEPIPSAKPVIFNAGAAM